MSAREQEGRAVRLTKPQEIAMRSVEGGRTTEEGIYEAGVSHRGVRRVANALENKGLLRALCWWGEEVGYEYEVTAAGQEWLAENGFPTAPEPAR